MNDKTYTSHDYADSMLRLAEFLKTKPAFEIPNHAAMAELYLFWPEKRHFLGLVSAIHGGKKEYVGDNYSADRDQELIYSFELPTGERVKAKIQRAKVCRLVRAAEYDCEPLLSQAEQELVDSASL